MTSVVSTVPAVLDAMVARFAAAFPDVQVLDGGPVRDTVLEGDLICVGFTSVLGEPAVEDTRTREQMSSDPDRESYDVTSICSSWQGEQKDPKLVRDRAYEILDAIAAELANDQTLGGLCMRARLTTHLFAPEQTMKGAVATIRFEIHVDAYTR